MNRLTLFCNQKEGKLNIYPRQVRAQPLYLKQIQIVFNDTIVDDEITVTAAENAKSATALVLNITSVISGTQYTIAFDSTYTNADQTSLIFPLSYSSITHVATDETINISADLNASNNYYTISSLTDNDDDNVMDNFKSLLLIFEYEYES